MYSKDFRERVSAYLSEGHTEESAVVVFKVSRTTIVRWKKLYREPGSLDRRPLNRKHKKLDPQKLAAYVREHPDAYLEKIGAAFGCTGEAVRQALKTAAQPYTMHSCLSRLSQQKVGALTACSSRGGNALEPTP